MAAENREQQWMQQRMHVFRTKAFLLITEILNMKLSVPRELVEEAFHSIFFLGKIIKVSPDEIFADNKPILEELRRTYPELFNCYSSHVPKRHPMSCVLDMIVTVNEEGNENNIIQRLQQINDVLNNGYDRTERLLISPTMCVSQNTETPDSVRYYGVSISASGGRARAIMIAASCCVYWDTHVADAVMTYYPNKSKKNYFDGTIRLPETVRCQAFKISDREAMSPCRSCGNLFGLGTTETNFNPYGNCAEVESVSNLFKNETEVKAQSELRSDRYTPEIRQQIRGSTLDILGNLLHEAHFDWNNNNFYPTVLYNIYK